MERPRVGSPPRVRGTGPPTMSISYHKRITPACAGNSNISATCCISGRDHPRVCGEQYFVWMEDGAADGSPPRVRGTAYAVNFGLMPMRITPACAGNSLSMRGNGQGRQDHPRVCGEQLRSSLWPGMKSGSPPRVRGTVVLRPSVCRGYRITPACAGNRRWAAALRAKLGDHPRVCGEQKTSGGKAVDIEGSPPRVRGTGTDIDHPGSRRRITPACAGNRDTNIYFFGIVKDHPRVCGEQSIRHASSSGPRGSPPRVRGTAA